jgi:ABC-type multidrug transport system ATPase subunit
LIAYPKLSTAITHSPATDLSILLSGVSRYYGRFAALRSVTAEFPAARLYAVVGENGAGKSTLLRILAGLVPASRGTVTWFGVNNLSQVRERISYMAHASMLYDELDAMENLRYFAGLYGIRDDRVCQDAMRSAGLDAALKRQVGQYSQGMRQRLSLARTILHQPELLLLDEPFSNVDASSARAMVRLLRQMRDGGRTVLVVTHQPALLAGVADEFVRMAEGRIVARTAELSDPLPVYPAAEEVTR